MQRHVFFIFETWHNAKRNLRSSELRSFSHDDAKVYYVCSMSRATHFYSSCVEFKFNDAFFSWFPHDAFPATREKIWAESPTKYWEFQYANILTKGELRPRKRNVYKVCTYVMSVYWLLLGCLKTKDKTGRKRDIGANTTCVVLYLKLSTSDITDGWMGRKRRLSN